MLRPCHLIALVLALSGCLDDDYQLDFGVGNPDGGASDFGANEDGSLADGGVDAGEADSGVGTFDGGVDGGADSGADGAVPDGAITDSAVPDRGTPDAGRPDTGLPDSGTVDAGAPTGFAPSNAEAFGGFRATGLLRGAMGEFDTERDCRAASSLGNCAITADACVCRVDELVVGDLRVRGRYPLVVLAWDRIDIDGDLDIGGRLGESGAGAAFAYTSSHTGRSGAQGGSFATSGGNTSTEAYGNASLVPLVGGSSGQNACGDRLGGGAGGALQLSAQNELNLGVGGRILAGGGGGAGGTSGSSCHGGAGGGSGGAVLLEADVVRQRGAIVAGGGGGGSGGTSDFTGNRGSDASGGGAGGPSQRDATCALYSDVFSGIGGIGGRTGRAPGAGGPTDSETRCFGDTYAGGGGGGGAAGRIRINTRMGADGCLCSGDTDVEPTLGFLDGTPSCTNTCRFAGDGECDDGGPMSAFDVCELGTDCSDCGPR